MKRLFILALSCVCCMSISLAIHPVVRNFNRTSINAGAQNWDIVQHKNNWIFFANNDGLLEFNSVQWNLYPIDNYTNVRSLLYDEVSDRIYAGAFNEFGYYQRDFQGMLSYYSLMGTVREKDRSFNEIWKISKKEDSFFFQGTREIFCFQNDSITRYNFNNRINSSGVVHKMYLIALDKEGVLMQNGDMFVALPNSEILNSVKICAILPFRRNEILFVTDFNGLYIFNGKETKKFDTDIDNFLSSNQVFCADIKHNRLAIGTVRNGVVIQDMETNSTIFSNLQSGLQNNTVLSVRFDDQDNIWLGLDKGIDYIQISSPIHDLFSNNRLYGSGYTSLVKNGLIYLGTNQGLYTTRFPLERRSSPASISLLPNMQGQVWSLRDFDNRVFCGTDHGAFIIDEQKIQKIPDIPGTWDFIELKKFPGSILASCYQGFFILKKHHGEWAFSHFVKGFSDSGIMFLESDDGNIWFSHWMKGVFKLSFTGDRTDSVAVELFDDSRGFYTSKNSRLYRIDNRILFPSDGGLFEYNPKENMMVHATDMEKKFGIYPIGIGLHQLKNGNVWIVTPQSVEFAAKQQEGNYLIDKTSFAGLRNILIPGFEQFYQIDDNNVLINTEDGFSMIDVTKRTDQQQFLKAAIQNVYLTGERDSLVGGYLAEQKVIPTFHFKSNSIRFEFVASEYRKDIAVQYSYVLENYDTDWSDFSSSNIKEYTKLPKGSYTFKVKARNVLNEVTEETSYSFVILPPWYESNWAFAVYFLIILLMLYVLFIFIKVKSEEGAKKMLIKKETEMHKQEERFLAENKEKEKEIIELKNQQLKYDLRQKSQELASSTMNLIRKNEMLLEINRQLEKVSKELSTGNEIPIMIKQLNGIQGDIKKNIERDDNWKKFEENFDLVYENYLKRLGERYPTLTVNDKKLCAYLKMGLSSKDIAPLMNMSFRSVEMNRYRLRKKFSFSRAENLTEFLQKF